jgi:thioredoxin-like negative regulator of GroEL
MTCRNRTVRRWRHALALAGLLTGCGAATTAGQDTPGHDEAAGQVLAGVQRRAAGEHKPVVAVIHADWCGPCSELDARVLDTPQGKQLLQGAIVLPVDFEEGIGGAVSARLRVLGLPTTVVLRAEGDRLREYGRIEGFETAPEYAQALQTLLERTTPVATGCSNADERPLRADQPMSTLLPDVECTAARLQSEEPGDAADKLRGLLGDPGFNGMGKDWPDDGRERLADAVTLLGRFDSRVARLPQRCAEDFARLAAWPALPEKRKSGAHFWHARCLVKAGRAVEAEAVLQNWLSTHADDPAAKELVADLLVHERLEPGQARQLLGEVLKARPEDDWAWYLLGELDTQAGDKPAAIEHLRMADAIKPGVALYVRHLARLRTPTPTPERVQSTEPTPMGAKP